MPWANLDDQFPKHPKVFGLSDGAFRLHVSGICYSAQFTTDGLLDASIVRALVPRFRKAHLAELVARGMWIELMDGAAYEIHDYLEWNRSRDQVEAERERKSRAGKKGADQRWHKQ